MSSDPSSDPATETAGEPGGPEEIRADIEDTREQLGDTVEALAAKTDVKARAQERVDAAKENVGQLKDDMVSKTRRATPESAEAAIHQVSTAVQERPLPFAAIGAFVTGVLVGWLVRRR